MAIMECILWRQSLVCVRFEYLYYRITFTMLNGARLYFPIMLPRVGDAKQNSHISLFYCLISLNHCLPNVYHDIFDRCYNNAAALTPVKSECDWNNVVSILAKSNISFTEKWMKEALVIPTQAMLNISLDWLHTIGFYLSFKDLPNLYGNSSHYHFQLYICGHFHILRPWNLSVINVYRQP